MRNLILVLILMACRSEDGVKVYNALPQATIVSHTTAAQISEGYLTTFIGQVSDANHDNSELRTSWFSNNTELCTQAPPDNNGESICSTLLSDSDTQIRLQVIDPEGAAGVDSIDVEILPTSPPNIQLVSPLTSGTYYSDQKIEFEALLQTLHLFQY